MKLKPGTLLQGGRYRIINALGQGGFGITYCAEQVLAHRTVCIKEFFPKQYYNRDSNSSVISLGSQSNAEIMAKFKSKFIKEAQTIANLDHNNIIHIYDVFEENNTAYYVMEYINGMSLSMMVNKRGPLGEQMAMKYIREVASALNYIHDQQIVHLDIKPSNIMVRAKDNRVILIDFGLSKHYDEVGEQTSSTPIGISHGYAPMEQYKAGGVSKFSPATDIYSLGATLYNLVTGCTPPHASDILISGVPRHRFINDTLYDIFTHALAPNPMDRPQSITEFLCLCEDCPLEEKEEYTLTEDTDIDIETHPIEIAEESITNSEPYSPSQNCTIDHKRVDNPTPHTKDEGKSSGGCLKWGLINIAIITIVGIGLMLIINTSNKSLAGISTEDMRESAENAQAKDLGLSVDWATYNIGATSPEEYGEYYAWGAIEPSTTYEVLECPTWERDISNEYHIGNISNNSDFDAATHAWGNGWRTPTKEEFQELIDSCQWEWIYDYNYSGVNGYIISRNGRSIFLPAGGYYEGNVCIGPNEYCRYWSSTFDTSYYDIYDAYRGYRLKCDPAHGKNINDLGVWYGMNIRPVRDK